MRSKLKTLNADQYIDAKVIKRKLIVSQDYLNMRPASKV